jgi:hypothetical protein
VGYSQTKPKTVAEAKQNLRATAQAVNIFAPIKNHPILFLGGAVGVGILARKLLKSELAFSLLATGIKVARRLL